MTIRKKVLFELAISKGKIGDITIEDTEYKGVFLFNWTEDDLSFAQELINEISINPMGGQ